MRTVLEQLQLSSLYDGLVAEVQRTDDAGTKGIYQPLCGMHAWQTSRVRSETSMSLRIKSPLATLSIMRGDSKKSAGAVITLKKLLHGAFSKDRFKRQYPSSPSNRPFRLETRFKPTSSTLPKPKCTSPSNRPFRQAGNPLHAHVIDTAQAPVPEPEQPPIPTGWKPASRPRHRHCPSPSAKAQATDYCNV